MSAYEGKYADAAAWGDSAGVKTLHRMASVDRYNRWVFRKLAPYVGKRVLEVGCGIGNMTPFFLGSERMTCIDVLDESVATVKAKFSGLPRVEVIVADIADAASVEKVGRDSYDTAVCINVLEHIEKDFDALRHMHDALAPGGRLLLFVPAGQYLYGHLDEALGHYRRYSLEPLKELVMSSGFEIAEAFYMNAPGIPGWFLSSRVLHREAPPRGLLWLFNALTPLFVRFEETFHPSFGQSLVCVARRKS